MAMTPELSHQPTHPILIPRCAGTSRHGRWLVLVLVLSLSAVHLRQKRDQVIALSSRRTRRYRTHGVDIRRHCAGLHGDALHSVVMQQLHVIRLNAGVCQEDTRPAAACAELPEQRQVGHRQRRIGIRLFQHADRRAANGKLGRQPSRRRVRVAQVQPYDYLRVFTVQGACRRSIRIHDHETHSQLLQSGQGRARFVRQVRPNYANERRAGRFDQALRRT